jgi:hypothetical protein
MATTNVEQLSDYCHHCGRGPFALSKKGTLYVHTWLGHRCPGSQQAPNWSTLNARSTSDLG